MSPVHSAAFSATKILLPIDFSPSSEAALEAATGLALQFHASIHLVHIIPENPDLDSSDFFPEPAALQDRNQIVEEQLFVCREQLMREGISATSSIETGNDIVGNLMRVIRRENADMIVISTHGLSGWRPLVLGSIAEQLIKQVNCTLLLLHSGQHSPAIEEPVIHPGENSAVPKVIEMRTVAATVSAQEISANKRLNRMAGDLARKAGRVEQKYDRNHSIFTK